MDKNSIIGLVLIAGILIGFSVLNQPSEEEVRAAEKQRKETLAENRANDSIARLAKLEKESSPINSDSNTIETVINTSVTTEPDSALIAQAAALTKTKDTLVINKLIDSLSLVKAEKIALENANNVNVKKYGIFAASVSEDEAEITSIENDKIRMEISSKGGSISSVFIKGHESYKDYFASYEAGTINENKELQLFESDSSKQYIEILPIDGDFFKTKDLTFKVTSTTDSSITLRANTNDPAKYLEYVYRLNGHNVDYDLNFVGLDGDLRSNHTILKWDVKGLLSEKSSLQERRICGLFYKCQGYGRDYMGEVTDESREGTAIDADIEWIAFKQNFFSSMLYAKGGFSKEGAKLKAANLEGSQKYSEHYVAEFDISKDLGANTTIPLKFYFGPNDFEKLEAMNMEAEGIVNLGPSIFRTVNKWMIIPLFNLLKSSGLSFGIIIILLTLLIKLIILPLTYKNYKSSAKMKVLKPEVEKIAAKYPDKADAMKKQQETMGLYKKYGASPMAGCIPMLIQMPILFAAFRFFPSSLDLRQKSFLWAEDLSAYDQIASWGGDIPFLSWAYGNHMSLFTILMCISTLLYTRMNSSQMPQGGQPGMPNMKVIMYFFPIMMLFFFNSFASGLCLYYLCGNVMNMGLIYGVKKYFVNEDKIKAQMNQKATKPVKQSKFQQRLAQMAKEQQAKQKKR